MAKNNTLETEQKPYIVTHTPAVLIALAAIILAIMVGIWWNSIYLRPRNVFEDMLKNNLSIKSVTKETENIDGISSVTKVEQISFVPEVASRSLLKISQPGENGNTDVLTESIGTSKVDYSQYLSIDTAETNAEGEDVDYSGVTKIWGRSSAQGAPVQNLQQSVLGLVPFANIKPDDRLKIAKMLINEQAYKVDYSKVEPRKLGSDSALVFPVSIDSAKYLGVLKELSKINGVADLSDLDPEQYKDNPPIEVLMIVDKRSRRLLQIEFEGTEQKEIYSSYGLSAPIKLPEETITLEELQQKIQEVSQ